MNKNLAEAGGGMIFMVFLSMHCVQCAQPALHLSVTHMQGMNRKRARAGPQEGRIQQKPPERNRQRTVLNKTDICCSGHI
jgi:hypothetical protein